MRNGAIASMLVVALVAGALVGFVVGNANERTVTSVSIVTSAGTATNTPTSADYASRLCLKEVPENATVTGWVGNSTYPSGGEVVVYANGTQAFFPRTSCPEPVKQDLFVVASAIESNPKFRAAENGTYDFWLLESPGGFSNDSGNFAVYIFYAYTDQTVYPCGGNSLWDIIKGEIQVTIPLNSTTESPELPQMQIYALPSIFLNMFTCTTTAT